MVWEAVFFLLVLKIPVVYLGFVVWWAVRAEPQGDEPTCVAVVADTPPAGPSFGVRRLRRTRPSPSRPHGRRQSRGPVRVAHARTGS